MYEIVMETASDATQDEREYAFAAYAMDAGASSVEVAQVRACGEFTVVAFVASVDDGNAIQRHHRMTSNAKRRANT